MIGPPHPTQRYIEGCVAFHEEGAIWYAKHDETQMAAWAREQAALWRAKLEPVAVRASGDGE